jgi:glycolate oxidase FAD binding subunit
VAAGLAGPARAAVGSVRDFVLGATMLNGRGELLTFGGQVMKNVAGYDVSRLMAGSMGVLGVICEVSLKVLPMPAAQTTLEFEQDEAQALDWFNARRAQPLPITASSWHSGRLRVRLAGARAAVRSAAQSLGGVPVDANEAAGWWRDIRDQSLTFFRVDTAALAAGECLWRLSVPASVPPLAMPDATFIEWGGAQRWIRTSAPAADVRAAAARAGGHATMFRAADKSTGTFSPLTAPLMRIHRELKRALDPVGIFNQGRLYSAF